MGQLLLATHHATVARLSLAQFRRGLVILNAVAARREEERKRREALVQEVAAWRQANEIRAFVAAVKEGAALRGDEAVAEWVKWALAVAEQMDPVVVRAGS